MSGRKSKTRENDALWKTGMKRRRVQQEVDGKEWRGRKIDVAEAGKIQ